LTGTTVFVFNLPRYALGLPFVPEAAVDDGLLDLLVFRDAGPFHALYYLWKVLCRSHLDEPGVFHRRVRKVIVSAAEKVPVQLDGDPGGYIMPAGAPQELQGHAAGRDGVSRATPRDQIMLDHEKNGGRIVEILPGSLEVIPGKKGGTGAISLPRASDGLAG
jgi:hypothetical protein